MIFVCTCQYVKARYTPVSAPMAWGKKAEKSGPFVVGLKLIYNTTHTVEICSICYDDYADTALKPCNHTSCTSCLVKWRSKTIMKSQAGTTCPFCRTVIKKTIILKNSYDLNNQKKTISDSTTAGHQQSHLQPPPGLISANTSIVGRQAATEQAQQKV